MLTDKDRETLVAASIVLRLESRYYYDLYRRQSNGLGSKNAKEAREANEKFRELERMARELEITAFGI